MAIPEYPLGKRMFDFSFAVILLFVMVLPIMLIALTIRLTSPGPVFYRSLRVGRNNVLFNMPKFRTMRVDTPAVATHLINDPERCYVPFGRFLRKTSLDELPQLWSIVKGDMSIVGPRPALYNQEDLIEQRTRGGVHKLVPGLTGWAQINGRDELSIPEKVRLDIEYMNRRSFLFDLKIILTTLLRAARLHGVSH